MGNIFLRNNREENNMENIKIYGKIYNTKDYDLFNKMIGNRPTQAFRVKKILNSIEKIGYITNPIIVNDQMEIIDGQARFEALKELEMPIDYIIVDGAGINQCIAMNTYNSNWREIDYINSYAEIGNINYIRLKELLDTYKQGLFVTSTAIRRTSKIMSKTIRNGELEISEEEMEQAREKLSWICKFNTIIDKVQGNKTILKQVLITASFMPEVNIRKLEDKIFRYIDLLKAYGNGESCAMAVEELYNRNERNPVYIYTEYRKIKKQNMKRGLQRIQAMMRGEEDEN